MPSREKFLVWLLKRNPTINTQTYIERWRQIHGENFQWGEYEQHLKERENDFWWLETHLMWVGYQAGWEGKRNGERHDMQM
jgi:hypothetical protein